MAGCCGRDGGSRRVGATVWLLSGLVLLGVWVARQVGPAGLGTPSRSAGPEKVGTRPSSGAFGK